MKSYLVVIAVIAGVVIYPLSLWTDRTIEFWLTYYKGHEVTVSGWLSFAITVVGNGFIVAANLISEIAWIAVN